MLAWCPNIFSDRILQVELLVLMIVAAKDIHKLFMIERFRLNSFHGDGAGMIPAPTDDIMKEGDIVPARELYVLLDVMPSRDVVYIHAV
jgi:hypothetical protein